MPLCELSLTHRSITDFRTCSICNGIDSCLCGSDRQTCPVQTFFLFCLGGHCSQGTVLYRTRFPLWRVQGISPGFRTTCSRRKLAQKAHPRHHSGFCVRPETMALHLKQLSHMSSIRPAPDFQILLLTDYSANMPLLVLKYFPELLKYVATAVWQGCAA